MVKFPGPRRFAPKTGRLFPEQVAGLTRIRIKNAETKGEQLDSVL